MNDSSLIRISQAQLNLLETCPPQFQRLYLEQLGTPMSPEQQEKLSWGSYFHLLMQQRELGLPIESLVEENEQLQHSIVALIEAVPELSKGLIPSSQGGACMPRQASGSWQEAEHYRTLEFGEYLLTVIYDLLITDNNQAQILDWKTYLQPTNPKKLVNNWQTKLYLYVLAETSNYLPEQISMTYWFVKLPTRPQHLTFKYSQEQHEATHQNLSSLLTQLYQWLDDYFQQKIDFPHRYSCQTSCPHFPLFMSQQGLNTEEEAESKNWLKMLNDLEEIPI